VKSFGASVVNALLTLVAPVVALVIAVWVTRSAYGNAGTAVLVFFGVVICLMVLGLVLISRLQAVDVARSRSEK
jgi:hypothetical protein